jgi:GIY-YIG catalytic domain-containing protein
LSDELTALVELAGAALAGPGLPIADAAALVPGAAGLYAVYGDREVWRELGLGQPPDGRPLYVGKAEDSLIARDLRTHFGSGRTGSSTLRRSFAALLAQRLDLHAQPRNTREA